MNASHEWWMDAFDEPVLGPRQRSTAVGDAKDEFAQLMVYVEFQTTATARQPAIGELPGHAGSWLCVYSSYERLVEGRRRDDEIEYSALRGSTVLAMLPERTGIWLDHGLPDGRMIVLPQLDPLADL